MPIPWYKQFWPWFLLAFPLTAVIAGIATVIIAMADPDGLVVADYYRQGLAINQSMAKQRRAQDMGLNGEFVVNPHTGVVSVSLQGHKIKESTVVLRMVHPTRAHKDKESILHRDASGRLSGLIKIANSGQWRVVVEPEDNAWRLTGYLHLPKQIQTNLNPG